MSEVDKCKPGKGSGVCRSPELAVVLQGTPGNHWLQTGDPAQALEMYVKMRQSIEQAIHRDPWNRLRQGGLAFSCCRIGTADHVPQQHDTATKAEHEAAKIRREPGVR